MESRDGTLKRVEITLCEGCISDLETKDWIKIEPQSNE